MVFGKDREYSIGGLVTSVAPDSRPSHEPAPRGVDDLALHAGVAGHRPGARHRHLVGVRRRRLVRRVQRRLSHPQPAAPPVRRGRLLPGVRADPGARARRRRRRGDPAAGRRRRDRAVHGARRHLHRRRRRRAGRRLADGLGPRALRRRRRHDPGDVPVHRLHLAGLALGRRPQHLAPLRGAGGDAGAPEPGHDRRRLAARAGVRARRHRAHLRARGRRDAGRRAPARRPDPGALADRRPAAHRPRPALDRRRMAPSRRSHDPAPDGAGAARRLGRAALDPDQHPDRLAPGRRRGLVAVLCRPADGVPDLAPRRRPRRRAHSAPVGGAGPRRRRRLLGHARLGPAPGAPPRAAVRGGAARLPRGHWSRRCSSAASSTPWPPPRRRTRCAATASAWSA